MKPWILIGLGTLGGVLILGIIVSMVPKLRAAAGQEACKNNMKGLALFAAWHSHPPQQKPGEKLLREIPAGTIVLPGIPPEERLSWVVGLLPSFDQNRQNTEPILEVIDASQPWPAAKNQDAARTKLLILLCPGNPPAIDPEQPALTQYVGIAGLGSDAASIAFAPPNPAPPRAGCFRYDSPTPFESITDGLSQSLLFGEHSEGLGPWLRGGSSTLRGLDDRSGAKPLIGAGGQFGGNHPNASNWALADGSVRTITPQVNPQVLLNLATIAGNETALGE